MNASAAIARLRLAAERVAASPRRAAVAWAGATFLVLAILAGAPGISRDEAAVLERADAALRTPGSPGLSSAAAPPLAAYAAAGARTILAPLGLSRLRAARIGAAGFGALLSAALVLLAWETSGGAAALLAPALFWAAPRHLQAGLVATPDIALAALAVATVLAWRRAAREADGKARLRAGVGAGVLFGAALAARTDAWVLFPALAAHAAASRALDRTAPGSAGALERRLRGLPPALVALAIIGPAVLLALWPALLRAGAGAFARATPSLGRPLVITGLTVPTTLLLIYLAGAALAVYRVVAGVSLPLTFSSPPPGERERERGRTADANASAADDALLLLCAALPLLAAAAGIAPAVAGVRPWLHAMPFLAVLGSRALVSAARTAWPGRAPQLYAALALVVLWPGVRAVAHFHFSGSSAWNELAGGLPGATGLGMPRQDGGDAAVLVLDAVNERARAGARVFWPTVPTAAVRALVRSGRLRDDLTLAADPGDADIAVVTLDGGTRDAEYRAWSAFRTARPAAGAYLDEVPLAFVYARPGAWR